MVVSPPSILPCLPSTNPPRGTFLLGAWLTHENWKPRDVLRFQRVPKAGVQIPPRSSPRPLCVPPVPDQGGRADCSDLRADGGTILIRVRTRAAAAPVV